MTAAPAIRIFTEPQQGATYDDLLAVARHCEALEFDGFFRSDHYLRIGDGPRGVGPTDAWITLAGIARETTSIRLGTLVSPVTFRQPAPLAIAVAQVDAMSGGRVELGLGTGWYEEEHRAHGIPFPPVEQRFDLLEEQLEVVVGFWTTPAGDLFSHVGRSYEIASSPALPKPFQRPRPPIIVGGIGAHRTPALAARFADELNVPFAACHVVAAQLARVRAACAIIDRDADSICISSTLAVCCGQDADEVSGRVARTHQSAAHLRSRGAVGRPKEVAASIQAHVDAGATRIYLQILDLHDLDHLSLLAREVVPRLAS